MRQTYKIFAAALKLRDFTASELAEHAGVKIVTVRTVLQREREHFEQPTPEATGRPGGQLRRYRLTQRGEATLRAQIHEFAQELLPETSAADTTPYRAGEVAGVPALLLVALRSLRRVSSAKSRDESQQILQSVSTALEAFHEDAGSDYATAHPEWGFCVDATTLMHAMETLRCAGDLERQGPDVLQDCRSQLVEVAERMTQVDQQLALFLLAEARSLSELIAKEPSRTTFVNATETPSEPLNGLVRSVLETADAAEIHSPQDWSDFLSERDSEPESIVITLNSDETEITVIKRIVGGTLAPRGLTVLDVSVSREVCDFVVLGCKGRYFPLAHRLNSNDLSSACNVARYISPRKSFFSRSIPIDIQPGAPAAALLPALFPRPR